MKRKTNREILESALPPMDARFDRAVRGTLEGILRREQTPRRLLRLALPIMLSLLALGAAIAAGQGLNLFNFFSFWQNMPAVQPEAYTLTQYDIASYSFEHVDVSIREAAWDGRVLRLLYSVRDRAAARPYTDEELSADFRMESADLDGISAYMGCDYVYINGVSLCLTGSMASRAGEENGEVLIALECNLLSRIAAEAPGLVLGDAFDVCLPFLGTNTPRELHFTVSNTGIPGVRSLALPGAQTLGGIAYEVTDLTISPIRVYLTVRATLPIGYTDAQINQAVLEAMNPALNALPLCDSSAALLNGDPEFIETANGEVLTLNHVPEGERALLEINAEFATSKQYPDEFHLTVLGQTLRIPYPAE